MDDCPCEGCPLEGEEYRNLVDAVSNPLYRIAQRYLADSDLGLTRWMDEPTQKEIDAIRLVSSESLRQAEDRRKKMD